jgi:chaperonin GroEL (HSP60 family)
LAAADEVDGKIKVDIDNIKVDKKPGGSIDDTSLVKGVVLDKEVVHAGMPKRMQQSRIALVNSPLEIEKPEFDAKISISSPNQMKSFLDEENNILKGMVDKIANTGANVLICQKGIDDIDFFISPSPSFFVFNLHIAYNDNNFTRSYTLNHIIEENNV